MTDHRTEETKGRPELTLRCTVRTREFYLQVDAEDWDSKDADERSVEVYEAAEEFDKIHVDWEEVPK